MFKFFEKNKLFFTIILIVIYVVISSFFINNFGNGSLMLMGFLFVFSLFLLFFIFRNKLGNYIGLVKINNYKKYLYFIPLIIIMSVNLWNGFKISYSISYIIIYILSMLLVGFIEEVIFRGFLFNAIREDNIKEAIIISSITFGIGHIVNLINGANFISTLLQVFYAISIGYLFVTIFIKSNSILPCIICHGILNALSVFSIEGSVKYNIIISIILIIVSMGYAVFINYKNKNIDI